MKRLLSVLILVIIVSGCKDNSKTSEEKIAIEEVVEKADSEWTVLFDGSNFDNWKGYLKEEIVAYARIFDKGVIYSEYCSIGRIATSFSERGKKFGHQLVEFSIKQIHKRFNNRAIKISAQAHLEKFYGQHGFYASGETYLEDGIPHIGMLLTNSF